MSNVVKVPPVFIVNETRIIGGVIFVYGGLVGEFARVENFKWYKLTEMDILNAQNKEAA